MNQSIPFKNNAAHKIVLLSLGGSVGKTMFVTQGFHPLLPDARILCVDQVNTTAWDFGIENCEIHSGEEFNRVYRSMMNTKGDVIVDVGGSKECKEFMEGMLSVDGSDRITMIIIPARNNTKDQGCAIDTIERLILDGVDKTKIKVIFTDVKKNVAEEFKLLIDGMIENRLEPDLDLMVQHSSLFGELIEHKLLISDIVADTTDYSEKAENRAPDDHTDYIGMHLRQRMAQKSVWPNLRAVFSKLLSEA